MGPGRPSRDKPGIAHAIEINRPRVLVVGEGQVWQSEALILRMQNYVVEVARSGEEALRWIRRSRFDVVLADLGLTSVSVPGLPGEIGLADPALPVLVCAGQDDLEAATVAVAQGAYDYLLKPLQAPVLLLRVRRALERRRLTSLVRQLDGRLHGRDRLGALVGRSHGMQSLYERIETIAATTGTVLILGEEGTGKQAVAREIHRLGELGGRPFHIVDCGELSSARHGAGHKGCDHDAPAGIALTGDGGTLYLRNIDQLPARSQQALLHELQTRDRPAGPPAASSGPRILAGTSSDLDAGMEKGRFLVDLFYHLSDNLIQLPPLRERLEDVELLCHHMLEQEARRLGKTPKHLSPRGLELLTGYDWPGNVAQLETLMRSAVKSTSRVVIRLRDLPGWEGIQGPGGASLKEMEWSQIEAALKRAAGNKTRAAKLLGIGRATFYRKLARAVARTRDS